MLGLSNDISFVALLQLEGGQKSQNVKLKTACKISFEHHCIYYTKKIQIPSVGKQGGVRATPQSGNEIEITLRVRYRGYGG